MFFPVCENIGEEIAADVVPDGLEYFFDRFAHFEATKCLKVRKTVERQNAFCQLIGMFHLIDGFLPLELGQTRISLTPFRAE